MPGRRTPSCGVLSTSTIISKTSKQKPFGKLGSLGISLPPASSPQDSSHHLTFTEICKGSGGAGELNNEQQRGLG